MTFASFNGVATSRRKIPTPSWREFGSLAA
jgi:hypothetical protein